MRRWVLFAALAGALGCRAADGTIERHGSTDNRGSGSGGEYGNDPGEADAKQDFAFTAPDDPDGGAADDAAVSVDAGPVTVALEEAITRIAHLSCQRRLECCKPAERIGVADATCDDDLAELLTPSLQAFARSVAAGRARYDGAALAACLASLEAAACDEARIWEPLLAGSRCAFVAAAVPAGDDCRASYECQGGFCQGGDATRAGRCVSPRLADGQPCERGEDCASGACHPLLDVCAALEPGNLCD